MSNLPKMSGPLLEERDGKLYYIGPVRTPEVIDLCPHLTPEERARQMTEALEGLKDFDFSVYDRLREFERKQAEEEARWWRENPLFPHHDSD